jgi:hypothetical protein
MPVTEGKEMMDDRLLWDDLRTGHYNSIIVY